jgi:hypothetical protein
MADWPYKTSYIDFNLNTIYCLCYEYLHIWCYIYSVTYIVLHKACQSVKWKYLVTFSEIL